jgi:hypothetical protein
MITNKSQFNRKNFKKFEEYARDYCDKFNKKIVIRSGKSIIENGIQCGGCCDGNSIILAAKNPFFPEIFVHEFSHLTQAIEEIDLWYDDSDIWTPLAENRISIASWDEFKRTIELERDCEARALKYVKKFQLGNAEAYAQRANIYLLYYQYVFLTKKWNHRKSIYGCKELESLVSKKLLPLSSFDKIDMRVMEAFFNHFKRQKR